MSCTFGTNITICLTIFCLLEKQYMTDEQSMTNLPIVEEYNIHSISEAKPTEYDSILYNELKSNLLDANTEENKEGTSSLKNETTHSSKYV